MIYTQHYMQGWNMVSIPCNYDELLNPDDIFVNSTPDTLFGFGGTYYSGSIEDMQAGWGYWLHFDDIETVIFECDEDTDNIVDIDGNEYQTVWIGDQVWLGSNLRTTHYNNGDEITYESGVTMSNTEGQFAWYDDDPSHSQIRGNFYNWAAVDDPRGICPPEFHVATDEEWDILVNFVVADSNDILPMQEWEETDWYEPHYRAGIALKDAGHEYWIEGNDWYDVGMDLYGFTALPTGHRNAGIWSDINRHTHVWTSTASGNFDNQDNPMAWYRVMGHDSTGVHRYDYAMWKRWVVRCVGD